MSKKQKKKEPPLNKKFKVELKSIIKKYKNKIDFKKHTYYLIVFIMQTSRDVCNFTPITFDFDEWEHDDGTDAIWSCISIVQSMYNPYRFVSIEIVKREIKLKPHINIDIKIEEDA